jgi:predicted TIM-barrel fold metal-dependent hydrolase
VSDYPGIDLSRAIIIDQHAHSLVSDFLQFEAVDLRRCFTESRTMEMLQNHVQTSLSYIDMIRQLGHLLDVSGEEQIISLRQTMREYDYVNSLFDDASLGAFIIDDGYSSGKAVGLQKLSQLTGRPVFRCLRIESVLEQAFAASKTFAQLEDKFVAMLKAPSDVPTVAFKTILAYRGGLSFLNTTSDSAEQDFADLKNTSTGKAGSSIRIERSNLYHYLLWRAFEVARESSLPVQIHTGLGDSDEDLLESNPLLLKSMFENKNFSSVRFVLLHCYPFVREAAHLAALYPNVYMDLSLACFLVSANIETILTEAISLAPISKILTGTDGHSAPETHWYGALALKRGLSSVLSSLIEKDFLDYSHAVKIAEDILHGNARRLYKLEGLA